MNDHRWDDDYCGNYYDYSVNEEQRQLLLALVRTELQNPNTQDQEEIKLLNELDDLFS